jgi:hypothetical protein
MKVKQRLAMRESGYLGKRERSLFAGSLPVPNEAK